MAWNLKDLEQSLLIGSTLVEGSTLTEKEAGQVLAGKTVQGHPIHEIRELLNYRSSVEWLLKQLSRSPYLSKDLVLEFHLRLFVGFPGSYGQWKRHQNYTYLSDGARHDYVHPTEVDEAMRRWIHRFNDKTDGKAKTAKIVEVAADLYYAFQQTHPFDDGNGRMGRLLIRYWLHWKAKLSWKFFLVDKVEHLKALESAGKGNLKPLAGFFAARVSKE